MTTFRRALGAAALVLWAGAVVYGMSVLWSYENTPAAAARIAPEWPRGTTVVRRPGRSTLVLALHPQCGCSQATVAELARLMARRQGALDAYALFLAPSSESAAWVRSDLWRAAAAIPGVHVVADTDGADARRFGAIASGQAMLYGADARLEFSGGITGSRGHEGDNAGLDAIDAALRGDTRAAAEGQVHATFVFGCLLFNAAGEPGVARGLTE